MRRSSRILIPSAFFVFSGLLAYGQCIPDTVNCKDTGDPGEICPRYLPEAMVNVRYDETITVIPPGQASLGPNLVNIEYIIVDSVKNLPEGIEYFPNASKFYPDTAYCIQVTGTPVQAGDYQLAIYVTPFIKYLDAIIQAEQVVNDSSVTMTVRWPAGIDPNQSLEFRVLHNVPNPFSEATRIGFVTPLDDKIQLKVINILGTVIYQEEQGAPPGEHYFEFTGSDLEPGTYFYRISNHSSHYTGKFIKSR